jgi:hypothetical protein
MITKGLTPFPGIKVFAIMPGLAMLALPLAWTPAWVYAVAAAGAAAVLAAAFAGWRQGAAVAAAAAIVSCAFSRAGTGVLAAEGLLILGYLLAAHAPEGLSRPGGWLRLQVFPAAAGLIASGAVLAALALHQASSAWLTAAGLAAVVGAYLVALPIGRKRRAAEPDTAGSASDVDVQ